MKIVINNKSKNEEIISFDNLDIINENIKKISKYLLSRLFITISIDLNLRIFF